MLLLSSTTALSSVSGARSPLRRPLASSMIASTSPTSRVVDGRVRISPRPHGTPYARDVRSRAFGGSRDESGNPLSSTDDYEFAPYMGLTAPIVQRRAFDAVEWHADSPERRMKDMLARIDRSGVWTVGTTFGALLISGLDSLYDHGLSDPIPLADLAPSWLPNIILGGGDLAIDPSSVASAESTLQAIFLFEFVVRAWSERFSLEYLRSPVALVDFATILPSLEPLSGIGNGSPATVALRPLRLFRLLRLLRLVDRGGGGGGGGGGDQPVADAWAIGGDGTATKKTIFEQVTNVAVEFLCVFLIAGELFYDLEYQANPDCKNIGDALYWSFLTLTGIGQPFEAVTVAGRLATVASILTALVVVPLQLANLVAAANGARDAVATEASDKSLAAASDKGRGGFGFGGNGFGNGATGDENGGVDDVWSAGESWFSSTGRSDVDVDVDDVLSFRVGYGLSAEEEKDAELRGRKGSGGIRRRAEMGEVRDGGGSRVDDDFLHLYGGYEDLYCVGGGVQSQRTETGVGAVSSSSSSSSVSEKGMRLELMDARRRLRAFEAEVDLLREENARLRERVSQRSENSENTSKND